MSQAEARAWWADVEHLREPAERRRRAAEPAGQPILHPVEAASDTVASSLVASGSRRTVRIRGQAIPAVPTRTLVEVNEPARRSGSVAAHLAPPAPSPGGRARTGPRRPPRRPADRVAAHPDRIAAWAFVLGMLLVGVAAGTAHGAPL